MNFLFRKVRKYTDWMVINQFNPLLYPKALRAVVKKIMMQNISIVVKFY
jgi:hypothetical protein